MAAVGRGVDVAIGKAKEHGMSVVAVHNYSSATGALGVWARKISRAGMIGIVLSQVNDSDNHRYFILLFLHCTFLSLHLSNLVP